MLSNQLEIENGAVVHLEVVHISHQSLRLMPVIVISVMNIYTFVACLIT
jgi:hypothetical protein